MGSNWVPSYFLSITILRSAARPAFLARIAHCGVVCPPFDLRVGCSGNSRSISLWPSSAHQSLRRLAAVSPNDPPVTIRQITSSISDCFLTSISLRHLHRYSRQHMTSHELRSAIVLFILSICNKRLAPDCWHAGPIRRTIFETV